jgi:hypothetical protein
MKIIYILLLVSFIAFNNIIAFAAMTGEVSPDNVIEYVVQERIRAQQEYKEYLAGKEKEKQKQKQLEIKPVAAKKPVYERTKKDIIVGIGLILIAIILFIYLNNLSKPKQSKG